jgi:hypothetical protein
VSSEGGRGRGWRSCDAKLQELPGCRLTLLPASPGGSAKLPGAEAVFPSARAGERLKNVRDQLLQSTTSLPDARGPCATAVSWSNGMSGGGGPRQPPSRQSAIITPKRVVRASRTGGPRASSPGTVAWLWRVPVEGPRAAGEGGKRPRDPRRAGGLPPTARCCSRSPRNDTAVAWGIQGVFGVTPRHTPKP